MKEHKKNVQRLSKREMEHETMNPIRPWLNTLPQASWRSCKVWAVYPGNAEVAEVWSSAKRSAQALMSVERKDCLKKATMKVMPMASPTKSWIQRKNE